MKRTILLAGLMAIAGHSDGGSPYRVFTQGENLRVAAPDGRLVLSLRPDAWGPNWQWSGLDGVYRRAERGAELTIERPLAGTPAQQRIALRATPLDDRALEIAATYSVSQDANLTMAVLSLLTEKILEGENRGEVRYADGSSETVRLPLGGPGRFSRPVRSLALRDGAGNVFEIEIAAPAAFSYHNAARLPLAAERLAAGDERRLTLTLRLPASAVFALTPEDIPVESADWFEWKGTGRLPAESVLRMNEWLPKPAGARGRVGMQGDRLVQGGRPVRFWGINLCYAECAPPKDLADRRADLYAAYGINAVRLHKFADGAGWAGILSSRSAVQYDAAGLERLDYFVARLKERGIY